MVVHIKTIDRDGTLLEGNGILFYAKKNDGSLYEKGDGNLSDKFPLILTLWHVVGLKREDSLGYDLSPNANQYAEFRIPRLSGFTRIQQLVDKLPLSQIDASITMEDGLCLLQPAPGFSPTSQSPTLLGIPPLLDQDSRLSIQVTICFNRLRNDLADDVFLDVGGHPRKNGASDSYEYPAPAGFTGSGVSGSAILPTDRLHNPPEVVFGLHWGSRQQSPPFDYIFLGTRTVLTMLRRSGYFYVPYDRRKMTESRSGIRKKAEDFFRWALKKLAPQEE